MEPTCAGAFHKVWERVRDAESVFLASSGQPELARKNVLSDTSHVGKVSLLCRNLYSRVDFLYPLLNTIPIFDDTG